MDEVDDDRALDLQRWGTRFAYATTESEFRNWQFHRTMPQLRALMSLSVAIWCAMPAILVAAGGLDVREVPALAPWIYIPIAGGAVALWRRRPLWWRRYWTFGAVSLAVVTIWIAGRHEDFDHGALGLLMAAAGATIVAASSDGVAAAAPSGFVLGAGAQFLRTRLWAAGELSLGVLGYETVLLWSLLALGCLVAVSTDRAAHQAYRQERIIEDQKRTITRERARSEELLNRELSHQVAERSRELGVVLANSDATLDVRALHAGERFAERYKIVSALGAGGMGAVYEVERVTDGATLALKAVVGEVSGATAARFAREAEIGARVRHPNLISIVDVGVSSGVPYLVMELVRGGSLEGQRAKFGDVAWALPILRQIAEGLAALHDAGVVHRDLKPGNVLLADGVAKISDFGISRFGELDDGTSIDASADTMAASPRPRSSELTGTGVVMGTPLYMAPEAARGGRQLDASADVFAFGILAYELLTGRSPFPVPAFVLAMAEQPIPTPPAMDDPRVLPELRALVAACVSGDVGQRPRAAALLAKLSKP